MRTMEDIFVDLQREAKELQELADRQKDFIDRINDTVTRPIIYEEEEDALDETQQRNNTSGRPEPDDWHQLRRD